MDRIPVVSSNVVSIGYDADSSVLEVEFRDGLYQYRGVPVSTYKALMAARSKGSYMARFVKDRYPTQRVT